MLYKIVIGKTTLFDELNHLSFPQTQCYYKNFCERKQKKEMFYLQAFFHKYLKSSSN